MSKKTTNKMWGGRFKTGPNDLMQAINASIKFDKRLAKYDIEGSRAHAAMLAAQGILKQSDLDEIDKGLLKILSEIEKEEFAYSEELEDIHMNIEARLYELIGSSAGRLHTARSRNDQVATDLKLWTRDQIDEINKTLLTLISCLVIQAEKGVNWVMLFL